MLVESLLIVQAVALAGLILIGGVVEGFGYGLSLGTDWPYHEKIIILALKGDPEAWHRIVATILGLNAVALAILVRDANAYAGLVVIALTALLGMATLHVLAGKAPAFLHGLHGFLAYSTFLTYLLALHRSAPPVWAYVAVMIPLHPFFFMVFLGGMVTGQRGYQRAIGNFVLPRSKGQWVFILHGLIWLLLVLTLAYYIRVYTGAFLLALFQGVFGFMLFQSVNAKPARPGILVMFHQAMAILILLALFFSWQVHVPYFG